MIAAICAFGAGLVVAFLWDSRTLDRDLDAAAVERWHRLRDALRGDDR